MRFFFNFSSKLFVSDFIFIFVCRFLFSSATIVFASSIHIKPKTFFRICNLSWGVSSKILFASCKRKIVLIKTSLGGKNSHKFAFKSFSFLNIISSRLTSFSSIS